MRVLKVLPARETSNGMEQMAAAAVLFLLSEAVGVPEGLQAVLLACQQSPLQQELPAFFAVEPKTLIFFLWFCSGTDLLRIQ